MRIAVCFLDYFSFLSSPSLGSVQLVSFFLHFIYICSNMPVYLSSARGVSWTFGVRLLQFEAISCIPWVDEESLFFLHLLHVNPFGTIVAILATTSLPPSRLTFSKISTFARVFCPVRRDYSINSVIHIIHTLFFTIFLFASFPGQRKEKPTLNSSSSSFDLLPFIFFSAITRAFMNEFFPNQYMRAIYSICNGAPFLYAKFELLEMTINSC